MYKRQHIHHIRIFFNCNCFRLFLGRGYTASQYHTAHTVEENPNIDVYKRQSFNDALLSSGFETVEYIGAFGTDDNWLDGWTNFDPNNTDSVSYTHLSTRGPCWTDLWFAGCAARCIAGYLSLDRISAESI